MTPNMRSYYLRSLRKEARFLLISFAIFLFGVWVLINPASSEVGRALALFPFLLGLQTGVQHLFFVRRMARKRHAWDRQLILEGWSKVHEAQLAGYPEEHIDFLKRIYHLEAH